jgi:hypothetical protein
METREKIDEVINPGRAEVQLWVSKRSELGQERDIETPV